MPPRGWLLAGWALLPIRAFLAVTFLFAGVQKLADPAFLSFTAPSGLHQQMIGYIRTSPIHLLLGHLLAHSTALGIGIALGELAVGLGMALGLWTRIAAIGGMLIAFSLFLAVSYHSHPWYTGADIVFFFAFTPFVVAGAGGVLSLDALIARRSATEHGLEDVRIVLLPFAEAQQSCGVYSNGDCRAVPNRRCAPSGCPFLEGVRGSLPGGRRPDGVDRRAVVLGGIATAAAATAGLIAAGSAYGAGRIGGGAAGPSGGGTTLPTTPTAGGSGSADGTKIGPATDVPVGQYAYFTVPGSSGEPGILIQESEGQFVAYNAVCPHAGCTVGYSSANNVIACPCHGSEFQVANGDVIVGPASVGLTPLTVTDVSGELYVK
jgi:thiosulfate dehydrogenase [quinone] large subunit